MVQQQVVEIAGRFARDDDALAVPDVHVLIAFATAGGHGLA